MFVHMGFRLKALEPDVGWHAGVAARDRHLVAVGSDLLVSLTTATELGSSSIGSALVPADLGNRAPAEIAAEAERLLLAVASSLEVRDWGLFS